jgi:hypothetical protein
VELIIGPKGPAVQDDGWERFSDGERFGYFAHLLDCKSSHGSALVDIVSAGK